jgi:Family of unknown function (DUF6328)
MAATAADQRARKSVDDERNETPLERLDRNTVELVQEVRVAAVGIQVLFAFLLVVPFQTGWKHVTAFDRYDYFVTLICIVTAAALLIAPSIHHRLLFRQHQKRYLVELGNRLVIAAMAFLTVGFTGIIVLISHVIFGAVTAGIAGAFVAVGVGAIWFGIPLHRRRQLDRFPERSAG